jgi:glycosyltransferase involved in cell wall biosynthesis
MLVNLTIPVFNEERRLPLCLARLREVLPRLGQFDWEVVIADNGSTDRTPAIALGFGESFPGLRTVRLDQKGRGRALKRVWLESRAEVLSYMDVDLSTDLRAFPALVEAVLERGFDLAIGSRLLPGSQVQRGWKREVISRCYNRLVRLMVHTRFSDAQCGFKAIRRSAALELLPLVEDTGWFFDTELLVLAEKLGYRIYELAVRWVDDPESRVRVWSTALADLKGLIRVRRRLARGKCAKDRGR